MKSLVSRVAGKMTKLFVRDTARYRGINLPAKHLRFCGIEFKDDEFFLVSAMKEADRLAENFGLTADTRLLDVGCGVGRLPIGILNQIGEIRHYRGVDVSQRSIRWCRRHIARKHPSFQFVHLDVYNPRYNPSGRPIDVDFRLPFIDHEFDIIYAYSVFSHMTEKDVQAYLKEFRRLLSPAGKMFLTAFIKEGVPNMTINPEGYGLRWTGPLHCVRYNRDFFEGLLKESGFILDYFEYATETDDQSGLYISRG